MTLAFLNTPILLIQQTCFPVYDLASLSRAQQEALVTKFSLQQFKFTPTPNGCP